ncbi:MAG TPA: RDD family protein [Candidatus Baltobacteraceae bacterium]|nr:RDD family protein [Candidatus Baltobacteraceae bacterium]
MDRSIDVRTPESVAFTYDLAGLGSRFLALALDQLLQLLVLAGVVTGIVFASARLPVASHVVTTAESQRLGEAIVIALLTFVVFAIFFGYFIAFETMWNGQTPGKKALGIRVVRDGGYPIDFGAAVVRNLIRVGEFALGYYLLAAISMLLSSENKRLGDFAAGTIVVRDAPVMLRDDLRREAVTPTYAATLYLSGEERALVKRFIEARDEMPSQRRSELAAALAARVRPRVPSDLQRLDDESLLDRL